MQTRFGTLIVSAVVFVVFPLELHAQDRRDGQPSSQARSESRIRDFGIEPGVLPPGRFNAITDVEGVSVGQVTLIEGSDIRTGVTAILPHPGDVFMKKSPAAVYVGNGYGKAAGFLQVKELGNIETPIVLTNTLSVGDVVRSVVRWTLDQEGHESVRSVNAVVGETNDGYLNDIRGMHVQQSDVFEAIESAEGGPVDEGNVGAGTGTRAFGFKGGIGTSSRRLPDELGGYTVGVLVQTNFGGVLTIDGVKVGEELGVYSYRRQLEALRARSENDEQESSRRDQSTTQEARDDSLLAFDLDGEAHERGSCMIVVATDAPLSARNLERLAKRALLGLGRTGGFMSNGSGDFVIAFSTAYTIPYAPQRSTIEIELLQNSQMSPLFLAVVESTEEAIYNSLVAAETMVGRDGNEAKAIPHDRLRDMLQE